MVADPLTKPIIRHVYQAHVMILGLHKFDLYVFS